MVEDYVKAHGYHTTPPDCPLPGQTNKAAGSYRIYESKNKNSHDLIYAHVTNAGHMVPYEQPELASAVISLLFRDTCPDGKHHCP